MMDDKDARIATLEAELARTKDALRQANSVRDTFALALVGLVDKGGNLQGHQVDKTMNSQVPNDDEVICPNCVHQFRAIPPNVQAELAERTRELDYANERAASHLNDAYKLRNELAAERERREAAEKGAARCNVLCRNLAGSWFYGNWLAETHNERIQEQMMRALGWWPITEDELVARGIAIDAAMKD